MSLLQISDTVWIDPDAIDVIEWIVVAANVNTGFPRVSVNGTNRPARFYSGKQKKQMKRLLADIEKARDDVRVNEADRPTWTGFGIVPDRGQWLEGISVPPELALRRGKGK